MNCNAYKYSTAATGFIKRSTACLAILVAWLTIPGLLQADVTASLDREAIYAGDVATLRITVTGNQQGEQPDLTPLQKDFEVLGTSSSRRIQIINGQRSDKDEWLIELSPRTKGKLSIPPIGVRDSFTRPLTLQVNEPPAASTAQAGQPVFISSEINPPEGDTYVQQQILYTIRLHYRVPLLEARFGDPEIENAVVERLGKDKQYKTTIDGQSYQVVERHYAVFPEHSGELTIGATVFSGRTASPSDQHSPFDSMDNIVERMLGQRGLSISQMGAGKRIRVRSDELTLNIKPRPDTFTGSHWLPSQQLLLRDSWAETPPVLRAGEPVTRTLTVEAKGLEASQLPEILLPETDTLRVYAEQPELSNRTDGDWIYGRSEQRFTYVVTQPGTLQLPEVRIDWWDSVNNQPQVTVLPAWEIKVEPSTNESGSQNIVGEPGNLTSGGAGQPANGQRAAAEPHARKSLFYWIVGGALLLASTAASLMLIRRRRLPVPGRLHMTPAGSPHASSGTDNYTLAHTRRALQNACARGDAQTASRALLDWAAASWPNQPPRSLGALARRVDRGAETIRELEIILYSNTSKDWNGQALWEVFAQGLKAPHKAAGNRPAKNSAPPLYPDWTGKAG
jgi:BatD DUF11 like domain